MEIIHTADPAEFTRYANTCLSGHKGAVVCVNETPCVWTGQLPTLDLDKCERRGLYVGMGQYLGGSIVNMPGDLSICITTWGGSELAPGIVDKLAAWLEGRGLSISRDENDVLLDGKKVLSWARATTREGWCQSVIHCSIGPMDLDLVREICTKPMEKVPGSLGEYGVTAEELWSIAEPMIEEAL